MMNPDQRLYETQAHLITQLREYCVNLKKENEILQDKMENQMQAGKFYLEMQRAILDNPTLQSEWTRFCSMLKLATPDDQIEEDEDLF